MRVFGEYAVDVSMRDGSFSNPLVTNNYDLDIDRFSDIFFILRVLVPRERKERFILGLFEELVLLL